MAQNIHSDILLAMAGRVLDELCEVVIHFPELMVCDWRAYAILAAYRHYASLFDHTYIPTIEECFSGEAVPDEITRLQSWDILTVLHNFHWDSYQRGESNELYEALLNRTSLELKSYTLTV